MKGRVQRKVRLETKENSFYLLPCKSERVYVNRWQVSRVRRVGVFDFGTGRVGYLQKSSGTGTGSEKISKAKNHICRSVGLSLHKRPTVLEKI